VPFGLEGIAEAVHGADRRGSVSAERAPHLRRERAEGRVRDERVGPEPVADLLLRDGRRRSTSSSKSSKALGLSPRGSSFRRSWRAERSRTKAPKRIRMAGIPATCRVTPDCSARISPRESTPAPRKPGFVRRDERFAVARAIHGASRQLAGTGCQELLDEFTDASGRPLRAAVEAQGLAPDQYLARIFFYDAPEAACGTSNLAVTVPGNRAIFVCGARFLRQVKRSQAHAEAIVIHEWLHTLGLGENPPSSEYITSRVRARCGQGRRAGNRPSPGGLLILAQARPLVATRPAPRAGRCGWRGARAARRRRAPRPPAAA